ATPARHSSPTRRSSDLPCLGGCGPKCTSFKQLILDALEVDNKGVRGGTNTDDQTSDTGQVQRVADPAAQQDDGAIGQDCCGHQRNEGNTSQSAEVVNGVSRDQKQTYNTSD